MLVRQEVVGYLEGLGMKTATHGVVEALDRRVERLSVVQVVKQVSLAVVTRALFTVYTRRERRLGHGNPGASTLLALRHIHKAGRLILVLWNMMVKLVGVLWIRIVGLDNMTGVLGLIHKLVLELLRAWTMSRSVRGLTGSEGTSSLAKMTIRHFYILFTFLF